MSARLVLLPGLGADGRSYGPQSAAIPDLIAPAWPAPRARESLVSYAELVASRLPLSDEVILGGSSFGGMVALEIAARLRPRAVVLIGSCTSPRGLSPWIRSARVPARVAPAALFRPRRWALPFVPTLRGLSAEQRELAWSMASATSPSFLKWGIGAILAWRPSTVSVPVFHIHGSADPLMPLRNAHPSRVVQGGGHLLTLTHSCEVNAFLLEVLRDPTGVPGGQVAPSPMPRER